MTNFATATTEPARDEAAPVQDLWFDDGNLILQAENSLFRIYRGLLSARSSVFKDMLAFPPPEGGNPMMDGCHIVTVHDSAKDMGFFLRAVFDSSYFEPPPSPTELPIVGAVLRLSLKYDVPYLHRRALDHLSTTFPLTLDGWKQRDALRTIPPVDNTPFAAFLIAREFDLPWLLPAILYCISSHPFEKTLDSASWCDEEISLCWPDKRMAIVGRQKLIAMQHQSALTLAKLSSAKSEDCTGTACSDTRQHCADVLSGWDMAGFLDYFEDHTDMCEDLCQPCCAAFKELCASKSEEMWTDLPVMFGLANWEQLERMRVQALE
ncbi:hypothetical protein HYPSUDRAFT_148990 [Hypholoma sublateritium FD-334 SS-4]|uniref:BTB domain-containing protein n=1 Tax=Hypholoma sublateritium (strain FD-334 SS-4) TaxID=945553 RepID=A0A0D2P4Z7_HYPSF|nr:hypothetical protein HYPSUDRAFT_148990 [Hypholoma sublateritium FD-334 SS-4]